MQTQNIELMAAAAGTNAGMDIIIVSTTSAQQEAYWQKRLEATRGQVANRDAVIVAVHEDWPGGAGNGLGTLYALKKASEKAQRKFNFGLNEALNWGKSVAVYHTAGKGTRLAPLPGSENNNKAAVKLPQLLDVAGVRRPVTLLESVIRQTAIYAPSRKGRVSVFWGDQIFVPSQPAAYDATHHADILCRLAPLPTAREWESRQLNAYGLIAVDENGDAAQVEKINYTTLEDLIAKKTISASGGIGISLGSFSISAELKSMLVQEFSRELASRQGKFDADPHFWMPVTLDEGTYITMMTAKGETKSQASEHYARMQKFKSLFAMCCPTSRLFGAVDIGATAYWWDYGLVHRYMDNCRKLTGDGAESDAMRQFFGLGKRRAAFTAGENLVVDNRSVVVDAAIGAGSITNSVVIGVQADRADVDNAVLIDVTAPSIRADGALLYNALDRGAIECGAGDVRADCVLSDQEHLSFMTNRDRDGGQDWHVELEGNPMSYDALYQANLRVDPAESAQALESLRRDISGGFGDADQPG